MVSATQHDFFFYIFLLDINECTESSIPVCSQKCIDEKGHYKCECEEGYRKDFILGKPGKTTCKIDGMFSFSI